MTGEWTF